MYIKYSYLRLTPGNFFSYVDRYHNEFISRYIKEGTVLDLGCGYGSLVNYLNKNGNIKASGLDTDQESINVARTLFPGNNFKVGTLDNSISRGLLDNVVLKDTLHHIYEQNEFREIAISIKKALKPGGKLIIFDPNVNLLLKTARIISRHKDAECTFKRAVTLLTENNYRIINSEFTELFGLPLSGGYVGICFIPKIQLLQRILIYLNKVLSRAISRTFLKKHLLWRYLIIAEPI